ncbi:hypothetical protein AB7X32_21765, partial [Morganella morganii]|uniref:hypothetical protein n=1 Tax=Morganella morganii TaxID=582 RepID=UPI0034E3F56C
ASGKAVFLKVGSWSWNSSNLGNWLRKSAVTKFCSFSVACYDLKYQDLDNLPEKKQLPKAIANGVFACLSGLDSREQLPEQA